MPSLSRPARSLARALALAALLASAAAMPALAGGGNPPWRELERLRNDRVQLDAAEHVRRRDTRWLRHELAVGNHAPVPDLRRQLDADTARIAQARARLLWDEGASRRAPASPLPAP